MKKLLILCVALMATVSLSAQNSRVATVSLAGQELRWGPTGGINFAWMNVSGNSSDCYLGFNAGVKVEYDMSRYIADGFLLDARLLYNLKGGRWASVHQNLGYLQLPVNFTYRHDLGDDFKVFAGLGPYFSLGVVGKDVEKIDGTKVKRDLFGDTYNRFDFGLNYNIGVEMWDTWQFFIGFEHSFINITKGTFWGENDYNVKPLNFYIGTAFMF